MAKVRYAGGEYELGPGESVLDCLLRRGIPISNSCRSGVCQSCLMKGTQGTVPARAQAGIKDTLRAQGYFLTCQCVPEGDLTLVQGEEQRVAARITRVEPLGSSVLRVGIEAAPGFEYRAGRVAIGVESYEFHKEVEGMYNMIVLRDGAPDAETETMRELRRFRKVDHDPETLRAQPLKPGESWTQPLDVSDYYDMTKPGAYQVTVTRESLPLNLRYSVPVSSNTITVVVPPGTGEAEEATEKPEPRFALTISAPDPGPSPPLMIRAEMENTSDSVIRERKCWQSSLYDVSLLRDGEPVEPNNQTRMLQKGRAAGECAGNATLKEIQPGAVDVEGVNIRYLYDIFEPGSYLVKISRETYPYNPAKSVLVESNTLGFTVSPPPPRH